MKNLVVFHHTDADGWGSAAVLQGSTNISVGYKNSVSGTYILQMTSGKDVAVVDFSFPPETMNLIQRVAKSFLWIDHHEDSAHLSYLFDMAKVSGIHSTQSAAARLTWEWVHGDKPMPPAIKYISDRDIWAMEHPESRPYCYGLGLMEDAQDPSSDLWRELLAGEHTEDIIEAGTIVAKKVAIDCMWHSRTHASVVTIGDDKFILANCTNGISDHAAYLIETYGVPVCLVWDIAKGRLSLHGRGKGARDMFKGLLKGHPEACGGSLSLADGWRFLADVYKRSVRVTPPSSPVPPASSPAPLSSC